MITLALTGSIGMGKSTVAAMFADAGIPVFDADAAVRALQGPGGAPGRRDRGALSRHDQRRRGRPRGIVGARCSATATSSPRWKRSSIPPSTTNGPRFIVEHGDAPALLFDIPLLFETGGDDSVRQGHRRLRPAGNCSASGCWRGPGMTDGEVRRRSSPARLPDEEKRARADFVIDTSRHPGRKPAPRSTRYPRLVSASPTGV